MEYDLSKDLPKNQDELAWFYNGIDCLITAEILPKLKQELKPCNVRDTYEFALAKQAPIMEMELRGIAVDEFARLKFVKRLSAERAQLEENFAYLCKELFGRPYSATSHVQVKELLYTRLALQPVKKRNSRGVFAPSVDEKALNFLQRYLEAVPFCKFVLLIRDKQKQLSLLSKLNIPRLHGAFLVAGTNTGRLASKYDDFGRGTNLQNLDRRLRQCFVADRGMVLVNIDLEQADARNVAAIIYTLFYETHGPEFAATYLDACESGDLHTTVCKLVWPEKDWTGDPLEDRAIADVLFYRQDSFRQTSKKLGHGTNYKGTPSNMAKETYTPIQIVKMFQERYFRAFPGIPAWHAWLDEQFAVYPGELTTLYGRRRTFFNRANDAKTLREAAAYEPQSMTGHQIDSALHKVWQDYPQVQLLLQVHDNILFQIPEDDIHIIPSIESTMTEAHVLTLPGDRPFLVPVEAKVGKNWGEYDEHENPNGLKKIH